MRGFDHGLEARDYEEIFARFESSEHLLPKRAAPKPDTKASKESQSSKKPEPKKAAATPPKKTDQAANKAANNNVPLGRGVTIQHTPRGFLKIVGMLQVTRPVLEAMNGAVAPGGSSGATEVARNVFMHMRRVLETSSDRAVRVLTSRLNSFYAIYDDRGLDGVNRFSTGVVIENRCTYAPPQPHNRLSLREIR